MCFIIAERRGERALAALADIGHKEAEACGHARRSASLRSGEVWAQGGRSVRACEELRLLEKRRGPGVVRKGSK